MVASGIAARLLRGHMTAYWRLRVRPCGVSIGVDGRVGTASGVARFGVKEP